MIKVGIDSDQKPVETKYYLKDPSSPSSPVEELKLDTVEVTSIIWKDDTLHVEVSLGGRDKEGNFVPDPKYPPAACTFYRDKWTPALWASIIAPAIKAFQEALVPAIKQEPAIITVVAASRWNIAGLTAELNEVKPIEKGTDVKIPL